MVSSFLSHHMILKFKLKFKIIIREAWKNSTTFVSTIFLQTAFQKKYCSVPVFLAHPELLKKNIFFSRRSWIDNNFYWSSFLFCCRLNLHHEETVQPGYLNTLLSRWLCTARKIVLVSFFIRHVVIIVIILNNK